MMSSHRESVSPPIPDTHPTMILLLPHITPHHLPATTLPSLSLLLPTLTPYDYSHTHPTHTHHIYTTCHHPPAPVSPSFYLLSQPMHDYSPTHPTPRTCHHPPTIILLYMYQPWLRAKPKLRKNEGVARSAGSTS